MTAVEVPHAKATAASFRDAYGSEIPWAELATLVDVALPEPPAAKPAKAKKAPAAAKDEAPCDWPGCSRHAFHPGQHDPEAAG